MKKVIRLLVICLLFSFVFLATTVFAGNTATQNINLTVDAINEINLSQSDVDLIVSAPEAGENPDDVTDASTTMSYSTNESNQKITAVLDIDPPVGINLLVEVTSTSGTSAGEVLLETIPADVITGLSNVSESGETITYRAVADMFAAPTANETFVVTYTITSSS